MGWDRRSAIGGLVVGLVLMGAAPASAAPHVQVSAGGGHTCALKLDQTLVCWGLNDHGQATPPAGTFTAVSAGSLHTCGIRTDATVTCWGQDDEGSTVPPTGGFTAVSAGGAHTCGIRTDATLVCWGLNALSISYLPPAGTYTSVSEGDSSSSPFACAVSTAQTLACWGYNAYGRASPPAGTFLNVDGGGGHTCGTRTDGSVACWGFPTSGQTPPTTPTGTFGALSAGYDHTCAIRSDASLACWGENPHGESSPPPGAYTALSLGSFHGCAIATDGGVACWGANNSGQVSPIPLILTQPIATVSPGDLDFASQPLTTVSAPQAVSVLNEGARALQVTGESFTGTERGRLPDLGLDVSRAPSGRGDVQAVGALRPVVEGRGEAGREARPGHQRDASDLRGRSHWRRREAAVRRARPARCGRRPGPGGTARPARTSGSGRSHGRDRCSRTTWPVRSDRSDRRHRPRGAERRSRSRPDGRHDLLPAGQGPPREGAREVHAQAGCRCPCPRGAHHAQPRWPRRCARVWARQPRPGPHPASKRRPWRPHSCRDDRPLRPATSHAHEHQTELNCPPRRPGRASGSLGRQCAWRCRRLHGRGVSRARPPRPRGSRRLPAAATRPPPPAAAERDSRGRPRPASDPRGRGARERSTLREGHCCP